MPGISPTTVPNVVGLHLNQATQALSQAGLGASVSYVGTGSKSLNGVVKSQSPHPGARVDQGGPAARQDRRPLAGPPDA